MYQPEQNTPSNPLGSNKPKRREPVTIPERVLKDKNGEFFVDEVAVQSVFEGKHVESDA